MPYSKTSKIKKHDQKGSLHPRNRHQGRYDIARLLESSAELGTFVKLNPKGEQTIDFSESKAVVALNSALLKAYYGVDHWHLPQGFLCPPIPGRVDYIHYLADILAEANGGKIPHGRGVRVLDIGTGASLIYPLLAQAEYGWQCVGSDVNPVALNAAQSQLANNSAISQAIELRLQKNQQAVFRNIISTDEYFHATLCNPPFHRSQEQAAAGTERKRRNLNAHKQVTIKDGLNFGGQQPELWCDGGEVGFIARMIEESVAFSQQVGWFTSLVSKNDSLNPLLRILQKTAVHEHRIIDMAQGQKKSRFLAWSFKNEKQRRQLLSLAKSIR